ncbi:XRE family transcriptional regulator [Actinomyces sp. ZJ308]|uniref:XRE family transcriptional regulator n=1 Tax=Actinomyces sp. ZJ308 TaxID=2708342 RepID=UPI001420AE15|nr:XRE family transcriptional regulator [Actinomyces sp. ZJ308]
MGRFRTDDAPALIRAARLDAGLTQTQLAHRAGLRPPSLMQMEAGTQTVSGEMLERVLRAADYRPSVPLAMQADEIAACAESHGLSNPRVFGSSVRGEDDFDSDIDLLVTPSADTDLFDLALFVDDVEKLTGFPTDVVSDANLPVQLADAVREAVPL